MLAPRHLPRLASTIGLFTRYGLAEFARDQGLTALGKPDREDEGNGDFTAYHRRLGRVLFKPSGR